MVFFVIYGTVLLALFFIGWRRNCDVFHPWTFFIPQFMFLYSLYPAITYSTDPERFNRYGGDSTLLEYQLLTLVLPLCLLAGVAAGGRKRDMRSDRWRELVISNPGRLYVLAIGICVVALSAWGYGLAISGGFSAAYGRAYGGAWAESGYIRELPQLGSLGALIVYFCRGQQRLRWTDWLLIFLCVAPILVHGFLGARRGPAFFSLVLVGGGWLYFQRIKISAFAAVPAAVLVGTMMLLLVANRSEIYLGSGLSQVRSPVEFLRNWESNEYLIGSAVYRYTQETGGFYGGREAAHLIGRILPRSFWPTVYEDLALMFGIEADLTVNAGVNASAISSLVNWRPSIGSATGFVGSLWLEFQYLSFFVSFAIGWFYGRMWRTAFYNVYARLSYLILVGLSVYLVMQDLDAWLFRVLLLSLPLLLVARQLGHRAARPKARLRMQQQRRV